ncbi:hypothetical protein NEOLEDRAFT_1172659 [Neolentinus lepideus HHB14362 ss-1]|uniref:RING-type domain-containing protein n=1 Tax=Neolentinus lepideus HHB14362 ss-1 TaxID=1314782 RepID=A0A165NWU8_9AGAM|nr:hypothetical protein NEOLEDRAFT_1172659 [Neolentinus lepideus HHB14362 ss-1]
MDIIDISSSPESDLNLRAKRRGVTRRRTPAPKVSCDIIEITDSDSDLPQAMRRRSPAIKNKSGPFPSKAGPSRGPATQDAHEAGSSSHNAGKQNRSSRVPPGERPFPLFLPEDDGLDLTNAVPKTDEPHPPHPTPSPPAWPTPALEKVNDVDLIPACLAQVLEIVPDVEPAHAVLLIEQVSEIKKKKGEGAELRNVVEVVLHNLFESGDYPKVDRKGKGRDIGGAGKRAREDEKEGDGSSAKKTKPNSDSPLLDAPDDDIDCGCCFSPYAFNKLIQCPDAHLFCPDCMTSYVGNLLGMGDPNIKCMDQSGCKELFTDGELRRFMAPKLLELYEKVRTRKDIEAAQLDGLEECPYCEYKVVIESVEEKLFRCENKECGAVTCRACKKDNHLPKSCKEVEDDKKIDARHTVEEAMTKALMRNCPKCSKAFIKESGCNKMTCPNCRTLSCYVCRQVITGYDHFGQPPPYTGPKDANKCPLWDPVEQRHNDEVTKARNLAMEAVRLNNPDVSDKDVTVDLPPAPAPGPSNAQQRLAALPIHMPPLVHAAALPMPWGLPVRPVDRYMQHAPRAELARQLIREQRRQNRERIDMQLPHDAGAAARARAPAPAPVPHAPLWGLGGVDPFGVGDFQLRAGLQQPALDALRAQAGVGAAFPGRNVPPLGNEAPNLNAQQVGAVLDPAHAARMHLVFNDRAMRRAEQQLYPRPRCPPRRKHKAR